MSGSPTIFVTSGFEYYQMFNWRKFDDAPKFEFIEKMVSLYFFRFWIQVTSARIFRIFFRSIF